MTEDVSKLFKFKYSSSPQNSNILDIFVTLLVLKLLISIFFRLEHPLNIYDISTTLDVSKLDISKFSKYSQSINIFDISVTFDVSKSVKLISDICDIPLNIAWQFDNGLFQINSKIEPSSFISIFGAIWATSWPLINILSGRGWNDSLMIYFNPISSDFRLTFGTDSSFLVFFCSFWANKYAW